MTGQRRTCNGITHKVREDTWGSGSRWYQTTEFCQEWEMGWLWLASMCVQIVAWSPHSQHESLDRDLSHLFGQDTSPSWSIIIAKTPNPRTYGSWDQIWDNDGTDHLPHILPYSGLHYWIRGHLLFIFLAASCFLLKLFDSCEWILSFHPILGCPDMAE